MGSRRCDGCGSTVRIAGGIGDFWTFSSETSGGIDLELADGTDHFLCFDCIDRLPDDREVTAADVAALSEADRAGGDDTGDTGDTGGTGDIGDTDADAGAMDDER